MLMVLTVVGRRCRCHVAFVLVQISYHNALGMRFLYGDVQSNIIGLHQAVHVFVHHVFA